jgi:hypothetical protein
LSAPVLSRLFSCTPAAPGCPSAARAAHRRRRAHRTHRVTGAANARRSLRRTDAGPACATLRANPCPEVTDPFCRLPLPTFVHQTRGYSPWRPAAVMSTTGRENEPFPRIFKGHRRRSGRGHACRALACAEPPRGTTPFRGPHAHVRKKRELFPGPALTSPSSLASPHVIHTPVAEF